ERGNAIYVVRAGTGELIWKAIHGSGAAGGAAYPHPELRDSIPSGLAIADTDADGAIDRLLVGDTGGNVWGADLRAGGPGAWTLARLACLGRHGGAQCAGSGSRADDRRFFHPPDLVQSRDA